MRFCVGVRISSSWFLASLLCGLGGFPFLPDEVFREFARFLGIGSYLAGWIFDFGGVRGCLREKGFFPSSMLFCVVHSTEQRWLVFYLFLCRFFYASSACIYPEFKQLEVNVSSLKESDAWPALVLSASDHTLVTAIIVIKYDFATCTHRKKSATFTPKLYLT